MNKVDLIHYITSFPLFKKYIENDEPLPVFLQEEFKDDLHKMYLEYCISAYDKEGRNYNLLRMFLKESTIQY